VGSILADELRRSEVGNLTHSALIVGTMAVLTAVLGALLGGTGGVVLVLALGMAFLFVGPRSSGSFLLRMQGAVPLPPRVAPELTDLLDILARRAGLPRRPRLYRIPAPAVTAFAVGTRENAAIGVTDGLLRTLNLRELAGVLAHEVSHIRRNDLRVLGLGAFMGQVTHLMSLVGQLLVILNLPLLLMGEVTISWLAILLLILAPTLSGLLQLALSRTREYDADLGAVRLTGDPQGLASALSKLERFNRRLLGRVLLPGRRLPEPFLLRTHPRTEERIQRLLRLEGRQSPRPYGHSIGPRWYLQTSS